MKHFLISLLLIILINLKTLALDVVYPSNKNAVINSPSVFFFGSTKEGSVLTVNSQNVKLYKEGIFVQVMPLNFGVNTFVIKSQLNSKVDEVVYKITRNKPSSSGASLRQVFVPKSDGSFLYTKTIKDNAAIREMPSSHSKRIIDIPKGVVLYLEGKQGDYYKIEEKGDTQFWIHKSNIEEPVIVSKKMLSKISKIKNSSDELYDYTMIYTSHPVIFTNKQILNKLILNLYGAIYENQEIELPHVDFTFESDTPVLGYEALYEDNKLIFKRAKLKSDIDVSSPLKGINIFIDAGHGGSEKGAVGPTRVNEKDINLAIAKKLIQLLKDSGANVSYSRLEDKNAGLYERVNIAKKNNALISLSIHCNSLPNGKDPFIMHGTEVHYYNENAKLLGQIIKNNLVKDLNLKDNGLRKSSFALNRSTNPVSLLIEVAYMINPEEYLLLKNEDFQWKTAKSVKKSLEEYIILINK